MKEDERGDSSLAHANKQPRHGWLKNKQIKEKNPYIKTNSPWRANKKSMLEKKQSFFSLTSKKTGCFF